MCILHKEKTENCRRKLGLVAWKMGFLLFGNSIGLKSFRLLLVEFVKYVVCPVVASIVQDYFDELADCGTTRSSNSWSLAEPIKLRYDCHC